MIVVSALLLLASCAKHVVVVSALLLLASCAKHVVVHEGSTVQGPGWSAQKQKATAACPMQRCEEFLVIIWTGGKDNDAKVEICNHSYVCVGPDPAGKVLIVQRWRK